MITIKYGDYKVINIALTSMRENMVVVEHIILRRKTKSYTSESFRFF